MKTMFTMGFAQDVFGSRMGNPMLGRVPIRMAQTTANGDQLLQQLQVAQGQVAQANQYLAQHRQCRVACHNSSLFNLPFYHCR